jgi:hypothetical protein
MGAHRGYVTAVVAGAMTAGIAASNVLATPPDVAVAQPSARDVDLAASITIPIIDIDTPGPISISRLLTLTLEALPNNLSAILDSEAGTVYDLPGLYTNFSSAGKQTFFANRVPGQSIGFGFTSAGPQDNVWRILGDLATGSTHVEPSRELGLDLLTGGSEGIGAALGGVLSKAKGSRSVTVLDSGFATNFSRSVLDGSGELSATPFNGAKAVGGGNLIDSVGGADFKLGSLRSGGDVDGTLGGSAGLCLGSAQSTKACAGNLAFASLNVPLSGGVYFGDPTTDDLSFDIPTNLAVAVGNGGLSVKGDIGGTVKVGSVSIGRVIPINIQIPGAASMMSSTSSRQQQNVRNSFLAVPGNPGSNNASASTGRHAARDFVNSAISDVKTTVNKVVNSKPKHAKPDTESDSAA